MKRRKCKAAPLPPFPLKLTRRTAFGYRYRMDVSPQPGFGDNLEPIRIPSVIPVFPLPNVVFFPRTYLPLHIFETRYRRMVRDAAPSHQMIGMVLLKEGWETDYEGTPAIFPIGAVGRMVTVQALSDGRFNILLQGLSRFEIQEELGCESYRQGQIKLTNFTTSEAKLPSEVRTELVKMAGNFLLTREDAVPLGTFLKQPLDDEALVQNLSFAMVFTPLEKQFLLEADSLVQQARRLLDLLQFKRYELNEPTGGGSGRSLAAPSPRRFFTLRKSTEGKAPPVQPSPSEGLQPKAWGRGRPT